MSTRFSPSYNFGKILHCSKTYTCCRPKDLLIDFMQLLWKKQWLPPCTHQPGSHCHFNSRQKKFHQQTFGSTKLTWHCIKGLAVWRMTTIHFWFLLILRKKSIKSYPARKLELFIQQNKYRGQIKWTLF